MKFELIDEPNKGTLPPTERYLNRLKVFKPRLANLCKWAENYIITEEPPALVQPYKGRFRVYWDQKQKDRNTIDEVYKTLLFVRSHKRQRVE
jgi:hypothetical protein